MANIESVNIWTGDEWVEIAQPIGGGGNENDVLTWKSGEWIAAPAPVTSVNGETGAVVLDFPVTSVNGQTGEVVLDAASVGAVAPGDNTSVLTNNGNGSGGPYIDSASLNAELGDYLPLAGGTMTGALLLDAGSAAAPGLAWDGDSKTGLYQSSANTISFSTDGTIRTTVNADGSWYFRHEIGVGTTPSSSIGLNVGGTVSANSSFGVSVSHSYAGNIVSAFGIGVRPLPSDGSTITNFIANWARTPAGAGLVSNYIGFQADAAASNAASHYGFYSLVAAESGKVRYGVYAAGNAPNRFDGPLVSANGSAAAPQYTFTSDTNSGLFRATEDTISIATGGTERFRVGPEGSLGVGIAATTANQRLRINSPITGAASAWEIRATGQVQADVTGDAIYFGTAAAHVPESVTARLSHFYCSSSGVTNNVNLQVGFWASSTMTGALQNHGFRSDMPDTGTNYNLYVGGAAPSYFNGNCGFGTNTPETELAVDGVATFSFGVEAQPSICFRGTEDTGIFSPATDSIGFTTGGTERLRINGVGNIVTFDTYYPAGDQEVATKKYVDDVAGAFFRSQDDRKIVIPISEADYQSLAEKNPETLYLILAE